MKIASSELITELENKTNHVLAESRQFIDLSDSQLNYRPEPESWSALECFEHLNLYGRFYLKELKDRISENHRPSEKTFTSGWLGNYFAKMMLPKDKLKPMKTFANMNPINSSLDKNVLEEFIQQQEEMLRLLQIARNKNLTKITCGITISKWIKLRLGDTFRFVIYHNERHLIQAQRVLLNSSQIG